MKEKTATAIATEQWEKDMADRTMQARLEYFYERWQPKDDPQEAGRFASELHMLVRSIYAEAAEPAHKQLMAVLNRMPIVLPQEVKP